MDLAALISQSATRIKKNWILFVPPILTQVVLPIFLFATAAFTIFPLMMALSLTEDISGLVQTVAGGAIVLAIAGFLVDAFVTAGWANMNKRVVIDGQTRLDDFWTGAKKYFLRILGGRILFGLIVVAPIAAGIGAIAAGILMLRVGPPIPPEELSPATIISMLGPTIFALLGILVIIGLIEVILYIFLLPWLQALVTDDLGILASIKSSFGFVRRNFATILGYVVISGIAWIAVAWVTSSVWPSGLAYTQLTSPNVYMDPLRMLALVLGPGAIVNSVIAALLSGFFMLLLFSIYADRTRGSAPSPVVAVSAAASPAQVPPPEPSRPQVAPRGMKYCVNCGTTIISLAVFCPNCGARQPPLPPQ